jgi:hypothetical protein
MYIPTINVQLYTAHMTPEKWETVESIIDKIISKWANWKSKKLNDSDVEKLKNAIQPFFERDLTIDWYSTHPGDIHINFKEPLDVNWCKIDIKVCF